MKKFYVMLAVCMLSAVCVMPAHALIGKPDYVDPNVITPHQFYTMCLKGSVKEISEALKSGVDVNAKVYVDKYRPDYTAIMAAARSNSVDVVKLLIKAGADVNARTKNRESALVLAVRRNTSDIAEVLLAAGASNKDEALLQDNLPAKNVAVLLKAGANPNAREAYSPYFTALIKALHTSSSKNENNITEVVRMLINAGTDINAKAFDGITALVCAARFSHEASVRMLLDKGADIKQGRLSFYTAMYSTPKIMKMLIDAGIDVNGDGGMTPLMLVIMNNPYPEEMINLLLDAGADANIVYDKKRAVDMARKSKRLQGTQALRRLEDASR